jgi:hypothetical protein
MPQLDKVTWETAAIDIDPSEFLEAVLYADECDDRVKNDLLFNPTNLH